jgi:DNA-directed RNA polymerase specialized sigma24 family protein
MASMLPLHEITMTNAVAVAPAPEALPEPRAAAPRSEADEAMARLADGDRRSLRAVHDAVRPAMLEAARRILGPGPDAEDATQSALHKLFAQAADFDRARRVIPWAVALVVFEARTIRKQHQRRKIDALDTGRFAALASGGEAAPELLEGAQIVRLVEGLMGGLSEADRGTLNDVLAENEDGRGPAFRKRKQRALERLREAWRTLHGDR